jgi:hypothetical protein
MMRKVADQTPQVFESVSMSHSGPGKLVEINKQLLAVIPHKLEGITHSKRKIVQEGCVVGISDDNGRTWKFVGGEKFDELFPALAGKLQVIKERTFIDGVEK